MTKDLIPEDYVGQRDYLIDKYRIDRNLADCYLVNFEDDYICHRFNGGCKNFRKCRLINMFEREATYSGD